MPSIGQTWVLASIGAVVEMGVLISTIETTAYGVYLHVCNSLVMAVPQSAHLPLDIVGNQHNLVSEILRAKRMTAGKVGF
jgi:hypothetical protein